MSINNCLFPGNRTSLSGTAKLERPCCEEQKASRSFAFLSWSQMKNVKPDRWTLSKLFIPLIWEEKSLSDFHNYPGRNGRNGAEKSFFRSVPWSLSQALSSGLCGKAQWVARNAVPYYSSSRGQAIAASTQPAWKLAEKWPITWEKAGEKRLGKIWLLLNSAKL